MDSLISVIVPVYNAEKYLPRCIMSILEQTYRNLEVILVNDGSPDNCGKICDEYAKKDGRIKVIHKQNGGVSDARNAGIDSATGEYIVFVDSDDWLSEKCIECLLDCIENTDMSAGSIAWHEINGTNSHMLLNKSFFGAELINNIIIITKQLDGSVWAKLFKRNIIKENNLRFSFGIPMCEDTQFLVKYMGYCESISTISEIVYNYDLSNEVSAIKKYYEDYDSYIWVLYETYINTVGNSSLSQDKKLLLKDAITDMLCCDSVRYYLQQKTDKKVLIEKIRSILNRYNDNLTMDAFELSDVKLISKKQFCYLANNDAEGFLKQWQKDLIIKKPVLYLKAIVRHILKRLSVL